MGSSRIRKASLNLIWLIIYEGTVFICNLILPRLIITQYGSAYNGIITSITQFLSFVAILRLGVAGATRVALYKSLADGNTYETSAIIRATEIYMRKIGVVIIGFVVVLAIIYPFIVEGELSYAETAILVIAIGVGTFSQYFFGITYSTLLRADQRLYIYNIIQTITIIINTVISSFMIVNDCSIQSVKIYNAVIFTISPMVLNRYVIWKYRIDTKCQPNNEALSRKKDVMGHSIANIVHENTDVIVLTLFTDVRIVSVYTVYNLVMNGLKQIMNLFTTGIESIFGEMWAKGENDNINKNLRYFEYLMGLFISVVFSTTAVLVLPFVRNYTKGVTDVEYLLPTYAIIIVLAQILYCFRMPYLTLVQAAGHYKETRNGAFLEAGLNLTLSIVLVQFIGIVGTAVGTLAANAFRTIQYSLYVSDKLIFRSKRLIIYRLLWIGMNCSLSAAICALIFFNYAGEGWTKWIFSAVGCVVISTVIGLVSSIVFYKADTKGLFTIGKKMIRMGK